MEKYWSSSIYYRTWTINGEEKADLLEKPSFE
jgi:hypothetical protein